MIFVLTDEISGYAEFDGARLRGCLLCTVSGQCADTGADPNSLSNISAVAFVEILVRSFNFKELFIGLDAIPLVLLLIILLLILLLLIVSSDVCGCREVRRNTEAVTEVDSTEYKKENNNNKSVYTNITMGYAMTMMYFCWSVGLHQQFESDIVAVIVVDTEFDNSATVIKITYNT